MGLEGGIWGGLRQCRYFIDRMCIAGYGSLVLLYCSTMESGDDEAQAENT